MMKQKWIAALSATVLSITGMPIWHATASGMTGDINLDGTLSISDAVLMQRGLLSLKTFTPEQWQAADLNQDGMVNTFDLSILKQNLMELGISFQAEDLAANILSQPVEGAEADETFVLSQTEFTLSLLQNTAEENTNTLISPYSVMQALAMTANGANGETKAEMEKTLGGIPIENLNAYLYTQRTSQPDTDSCKLLTANSIWYRDDAERIQVSEDFLQTNADYYNAAAYSAPFDESTVRDINAWIGKNTDYMIPKMIDKLEPYTVMCLINAVTFDAKWMDPYEENQMPDGIFTAYDGTAQTVQMMHSDESFYLEDENATGFLKYYEGGRYAFAALLPKEGISVTEYLNGLTPESLHDTLANPVEIPVMAGLPKFSCDYDINLNETLADMGMPGAFYPTADFSNMAKTKTGLLFISDVLHKTHIDVDENGTKAGAATVIICNDTACMPIDKIVILNRPFVYCIVDTETALPVFIGTMLTIQEA
ncbi:MAG: serpin family protein [Ruminococcus sp.]